LSIRVLANPRFEVENVNKEDINILIDEIYKSIKITEDGETKVNNTIRHKTNVAEAARVIGIKLDPSLLYGLRLDEFSAFFRQFQFEAKNRLSDAFYDRLLKAGPLIPVLPSADMQELTHRLYFPPPPVDPELIDRLCERGKGWYRYNSGAYRPIR